MKRSEVLSIIAEQDGLLVANIGFPSRELYALHDRPENFYMLGSMGMASSIGLGLALSQDRRVYAIDGDGSILMNMGSLATIAHNAPGNYCLVIIDNGAYGSTGNQPTYTSEKTNLADIARAAGNRNVKRVGTIDALKEALRTSQDRTAVIVVETEPGNDTVPVIPLDPVIIKERFMKAVQS